MVIVKPPVPAVQRIAGPFTTALGSGDSLQAQNTFLVANGCIAWANDVELMYFLDKNDDSTPPSGIAVIEPALGPGRWLIMQIIPNFDYIEFGADPASSGEIRFSLNNSIRGHNLAGVGSSSLLRWRSDGTLQIGDVGTGGAFLGCDILISSTTLDIRRGGNIAMRYESSGITIQQSTALLEFANGLANPTIRQRPSTASGVNGSPFITNAQDQSGNNSHGANRVDRAGDATGTGGNGGTYSTRGGNSATGTPGNWECSPGTGGANGGIGHMRSGSGLSRVAFDNRGVAFNGNTPITKPAVATGDLAATQAALVALGLISLV